MKKDFKGPENEGGIYRIVNIRNGKFYIGSARNFLRRARDHEFLLKNQKHANKHLQASWNKWGEEAFVFEVVEIVEGNKGERYKVEQKYIDKLIKKNLWNQTFNIGKKTIQNERSCFSKNPEETRRKGSEISKKLHRDPEFRIKYKEGRKKAAEKRAKTYEFVSPNGEFLKITNLKEFCRKHNLSDSGMHAVWLERKKSYKKWTKHNPSKSWGERNKPVYQYNFDGSFIKKWNSASDAARALGCSRSLIQLVALGKNKTGKGFLWSYDELIDFDKIKRSYKGYTKPVFQYNLDGSFIKKWNSVSEAARSLGLKGSSKISECANKKRKTAAGFVWRYDNDPPKSK